MTRQERRQVLGVQQEKLCLLLGWDKYRKGLDIAIKAVEKLRQTDSMWHLGVVGMGERPSEALLQWIRSHTEMDGTSSWIHYFPSAEDMFSYHRAVDVYLSASRKEAFSYGLLEAISQNTPVVVSDIEGTAWAQEYDKCAVYPVEDANACADAIAKAFAFGNRESNRSVILNRFSIDLWCSRILDIYSEMMK